MFRIIYVLLVLFAPPVWCAESCPAGTLYLTLDSGSMSQAESIAHTLQTHHIKATFFVANEPTLQHKTALNSDWGYYWRARLTEGNKIGNHTASHLVAKKDLDPDHTLFRSLKGQTIIWDQQQFCQDLQKNDQLFFYLTHQHLNTLWRAPGGRTTPNTKRWAKACGYPPSVGWSKAGFLGDELPSDRWPNSVLLKQALKRIRDQDILMMHLGIRSRVQPFADVFEPLMVGLQEKGFCFATLP